jgi:hypothetical protein
MNLPSLLPVKSLALCGLPSRGMRDDVLGGISEGLIAGPVCARQDGETPGIAVTHGQSNTPSYLQKRCSATLYPLPSRLEVLRLLERHNGGPTVRAEPSHAFGRTMSATNDESGGVQARTAAAAMLAAVSHPDHHV